MRILAIDTATEACSVALWNDGVIYAHFKENSREHSQHLLTMVKTILRQGNATLSELDALAFSRGPGRFTGVRICIGTVQGLALGAVRPVIGVSTLVTIAQGAWRKLGATQVLVAIDARMGEVYWAEYTRDEYGVWHGEETEMVLKPDAVSNRLKKLSGDWTPVGTGWQICPEMANCSTLGLVNGSVVLLPEAEDMLPIACHLLAAGRSIAVEHAAPVYLRDGIAWKKLIEEN